MNRKKLLPLAVLAGVVVLLALLLAVVSWVSAQEEDSSIPLFGVGSDSISLLSYQGDGSDVSLTRQEDGGWVLDTDPLLPIDPDKVQEVLDGLTGMSALRSLTGSGGDEDSMGFDSPTMAFSFTADGTEYTLTVGAQNTMADSYYVKLSDGGLYTVSTSAFVGLCKSPSQLYLAQDITDIESTQVSALTLDTGNELLQFSRDSEGNWTLTDDPSYDLDQDAVSRMSNTICSLTSEWSITSPDTDSVYGLDQPNAVVTLTASDGRTVTCRFGTTDPDNSDWAYLQVAGSESVVYEIAANNLSVFACTRESLKAATPESATGEDADSSQ